MTIGPVQGGPGRSQAVSPSIRGNDPNAGHISSFADLIRTAQQRQHSNEIAHRPAVPATPVNSVAPEPRTAVVHGPEVSPGWPAGGATVRQRPEAAPGAVSPAPPSVPRPATATPASNAPPPQATGTPAPWANQPWAAWFSKLDPNTGNVISPFGPGSLYSDPTEHGPDGQLIHLNSSGTGIGPGGPWASLSLANYVASVLGGQVYDAAPNFAGGYGFNQPQYMVKLANGAEINPGEIALYFMNGAGPSGNAAYLNQWLKDYTAAPGTGPGDLYLAKNT